MNTQEIVSKLAADAGVSEEQAQTLFNQMVPVVGMQLKKNAANEKEEILEAVEKHAQSQETDPTALAIDGKKILGHVFKGNAEEVEKTLAANSSIDTEKAGDLVKEFAPLVLGAFGEDGLSKESLEKVLEKTAEQALKGQSDSVQGLLKFLDLDKDGSVIDDIPKVMVFLKGLMRFIPRSK